MFKELVIDQETGNVKTVVDEKTKVVRPVFLDEKGAEVPVDVPSMYQKIIDLGAEAKNHRLSKEELETKFAKFADVEDFEQWYEDATKAVETVANLNEKDWLKAEKVQQMKD